ncbi:MAG: alpha/beta hydrolase, partial [Desulfocapsaceae bacterium]
LYMTEKAYNQATNARDKELYLIDGATHIQTYWKTEYVNEAMGKLEQFFGKNLDSRTASQEAVRE